jgi:hypothetical protein
MRLEALKINSYGFLDVAEGIFTSRTLGHASGQRWNLRYEYAVLITLNSHAKLHSETSRQE